MDDDRNLPNATPERDYDTLAESPPGLLPSDRPKVPGTLPPAGACDCHLHMVGGAGDAPLWEKRPEDPATKRGFEDWLDLLRMTLSTLELNRGVIVHSVLHGDDNGVTIRALERLGPEFRGVGLVRDDATDAALDRLRDGNIGAILLNEVHDWPMSWQGAQALAPRLADRGMHLETLMPRGKIAERADEIEALPCTIVFDHLGWPDLSQGIEAPDFQAVLKLVGENRAWVKLSGIYRLTQHPYDAADRFVEKLVAANPDRCLWGSDWPHLLLKDNALPDAGVLLDTFFRAVPDPETRQKILVTNPAVLYRF